MDVRLFATVDGEIEAILLSHGLEAAFHQWWLCFSGPTTSASRYIKKLEVIERFLKEQKNTAIQTDIVVQQLGKCC